MICPDCSHFQTLQESFAEKFSLYRCDRCGGFWFSEADPAVLDNDTGMNWIDVAFWENPDRISVAGNNLICPQCRNRRMLRIHDEATDTTACTCPACNGIWLGAGHLESIVAALSEAVNRMDSADYAKQSLRLLADMLTTPSDHLGEEWRNLKTVLRLLTYRLYSGHPKVVKTIADTLNSLPV